MRKIKIDAYNLLEKVRADKPLVHHLTNWVTIYDCASIVKALGGSPVMAHAAASALVCFEIAAECATKLSAGPGTFSWIKKLLIRCRR